MKNSEEKFDLRNEEKKSLNINNYNDFYVNSREIWYIKMGINIGCEENGKKEFRRPVLVIKKVGSIFFTVAMTSKGKSSNRFYYELKEANINKKNIVVSSYCILSQVKVIDKRRFMHKIGEVGVKEFLDIKKKLIKLLL